MVDKGKILKIFDEYFKVYGGTSVVRDDGIVDCTGFVEMTKSADRFPIKFGIIGKSFVCSQRGLKTLEGGPQEVGRMFVASYNNLTSLEGAPETVADDFNVDSNPLTSLKGAPSSIGGGFMVDYNPNLPLLRTLSAKHVRITYDPDQSIEGQIEDVLNEFAGQGKRGVLPCTKALLTLEKELGKDIRANIKW